jgi:hypothetical protein
MIILLCAVLSAAISAAVCTVGAILMNRSVKQRFAQRDLSYDKRFSCVHQEIAEVEAGNTAKITELKGEITALRERKPQEGTAVDFNAGIAAILGYDPMEVRKKMRESQRSEDI